MRSIPVAVLNIKTFDILLGGKFNNAFNTWQTFLHFIMPGISLKTWIPGV